MPAPADRPPLQQTGPLPLVGREREWATLRQRLAAAREGRGGLVLISGDAGIGKTALAEALCREASAQGATVLVGRCYDRTETPPYGPWLDMFTRYSALADVPPPSMLTERAGASDVDSQAALFGQIQDFFTALAMQHPLLLLIDDLQWSDATSLELLRTFARSLAAQPLLLVTTYRTEELDRHHPLYHVLPALIREASATRLDLHPLQADDIEMLVTQRYRLSPADVAALVRYLHRRAEGNPLFTLELLRALEEEDLLRRTVDGADGEWTLNDSVHVAVPSLLRQVIDGRITRLGEDAYGLLAVAAVIGQEVPLSIWATVADVDEERLLPIVERAVRAHLLAEDPDGVRISFVHALVREVLYESVLASRRRRLHGRVAETLAALPESDPDAIAYHFQQAGDARAIPWLMLAGDRARRTYAYIVAAERYRAALAAADSHGTAAGERGWLMYRLARTDRSMAPAQRLAAFDEAISLAVETNDDLLAAEAHYRRSLLRCDSGNLREGLQEMTAAVAALEALSPADQERLAAAWETIRLPPAHGAQVAAYLAMAGRYAEAQTHAERFLADLGASNVANRLIGHAVAAYNGLAAAFTHLGHPEEARRVYVRSRELRRTAYPGSTSGVSALAEYIWVARPYYADERAYCHGLALESEQEYAQYFRARRESARVDLRFTHLPALYDGGEWQEARALAIAMRAAFVAYGPAYEIPTGVLGLLAYEQGDRELAWSLVHERFPPGSQVLPGDIPFDTAVVLLRIAAALATETGEWDTARGWLETHDRWLAWSGSVLWRVEGQLGWAAYYRARDDALAAYRAARQALAHATEPRQPLGLLAAHRLLGELDTDTGRYAEAATHLDMALRLADACAAPYERALTLLALAARAIATGDGADAYAFLDEARALCTPLGAAPALARADALAARLARGASATSAYPAGLSEREVEVLRLVARGLSNRDIADTLSLSERTVHVHVRNILMKTETENRAGATAFAFRHGLT